MLITALVNWWDDIFKTHWAFQYGQNSLFVYHLKRNTEQELKEFKNLEDKNAWGECI
jgi:hypothetical protein